MSWPRIQIDQLCETIVDCVNRTAPVVNIPTPFKMIRTTNVKSGWINLEEVRYVDEATYNIWTRRQVPKRGDVILTREAPLGEVGIIRTDDRVFLGQRLVAYRADPRRLDARFLLYTLQGSDLKGQIRALGSGSTVEHMRVPDAKALLIPTPPLDIQKRIADILSAYDDLIENNTRRIAILEDMARRLFEDWFVKPATLSLPEGWEVAPLRSVMKLHYGKALKADNRIDGPFPVYGSSGAVGSHNTSLVGGPGIILGRKGNVGSVFYSAIDFYPIDTVFYVETNLSLHFVYQILRQQTFTNSDSAVPGLNRELALSKEVALPPHDLIDRYDAWVSPVVKQALSLRNANTNLLSTRDLLLPKLISGEIEVRSAEAKLEAAAA